MYLKQSMKRVVAIVLILIFLMSMSACSASEIYGIMGLSTGTTPGEKLSGSEWINSEIEGTIDENTQLNLKDDFHATVNRDWILENEAEGDQVLSSFTEIDDALTEMQLRLFDKDALFTPDTNIMSSEALAHLQKLIWDMAELAGNQDKRNELGVEPLRPYL